MCLKWVTQYGQECCRESAKMSGNFTVPGEWSSCLWRNRRISRLTNCIRCTSLSRIYFWPRACYSIHTHTCTNPFELTVATIELLQDIITGGFLCRYSCVAEMKNALNIFITVIIALTTDSLWRKHRVDCMYVYVCYVCSIFAMMWSCLFHGIWLQRRSSTVMTLKSRPFGKIKFIYYYFYHCYLLLLKQYQMPLIVD